MSNPFIAKFDSECGNCAGLISEGEDKVFAHNGIYVDEKCAELLKIICPECNEYKKPEFDVCFKCLTKETKW